MIQKPRGTQDFYNNEAKLFTKLREIMTDVATSFNFNQIDTPIFEAKELFVRSVGNTSDVVEKEMYELIDKKGREFVLRPEGTASIVRAVIENKLYTLDNLPLKVHYFGPMFRYERPQIGRNRQFHQFGVEVFGPNSFFQDVELIQLALEILNRLSLKDSSQVHINYLVSGTQRKEYISALIESLSNLELCDDCQRRIITNPLRVLDCKIDSDKFDQTPIMQDYLSDDDRKYFHQLIELLDQLNINYIINHKLVRGLDYYTGFIFEIKSLLNDLGNQDTILGGGRYNNLMIEMSGQDLPAAGFAIGIERLMITLTKNRIDLVKKEGIDLYTIPVSNEAQILNFNILTTLRKQGFKIETDLMKRSIKSNFKQAEKLQAKNIIILGDQEIATNKIEMKNQLTKVNTLINLDEIEKYLK